MNSPIHRLTPVDMINLYAESPSAPARVGAIAVLDGHLLVGPVGGLHLDAIRRTLDRRLRRVPRLRQVIHRGGRFSGRPVWADDPAFRIERHVRQLRLLRGDNLNDLAMRLVVQPFDPAHPPWRMWFITGMPDHRVGLVFAMHHVVADGVTTVRLFGALTDATAEDTIGAMIARPQPPPSWRALVRDNLGAKFAAVRRWHRPDLAGWDSLRTIRNAPRTSLNLPVGPRRRIETVTVDLAAAKQAAHDHGGRVNDLVLALAAGGLRALLAARSERVDGIRLHVSVAQSLRGADELDGPGNRSGGFAVRLPLDADPHVRLRKIVRESAAARRIQPPTTGNSLLVGLSRLGLLRFFSRRQKMINVVESNVAGPAAALRLMGAPILEVVPVGTLVGNLTIGFLALSYAGRLTVAVQVDADRYPDLPALLTAMHRECATLMPSTPPRTEPIPAELTAQR